LAGLITAVVMQRSRDTFEELAESNDETALMILRTSPLRFPPNQNPNY
jgi:hypothetical protein